MKKFISLLAVAALLAVGCENDPYIIAVRSVTMSQTKASVNAGSSIMLSATISPKQATTESVTWASSNPNVATVSYGKVTGIDEGTAIITATADDKVAQCVVTVYAAVSSITFEPAAPVIYGGQSVTLTATVLPEAAAKYSGTWSSSNTDVAVVSNGVVTGVGAGTATIYYDVKGFVGSCPVTVLSSTLYYEDFASEAVEDEWTIIDADGDGYTWLWSDQYANHSTDVEGILLSQSYYLGNALTPDNWAFTPQIEIPDADAYVSAWVVPQDKSYPYEHYAMYVTIIEDGAPAVGTAAYEQYLMDNAIKKIEGYLAYGYGEFSSNPKPKVVGTWENIVFKLPEETKGKTVSIGFRHYDCTDMFYIDLDDVLVTTKNPAASEAPALSTAYVKGPTRN